MDLNVRIAKDGIMALPRYRIAQWLGWTDIRIGSSLKWLGTSPQGDIEHLTDWPNDFNLMHELVLALDKEERYEYLRALAYITGSAFHFDGLDHGNDIFIAVEATAEQKAMAYLKVKEQS